MSDAFAESSWTIAIRPKDGEPLRKITKIISLNGKGFSVLSPYHKAKEGYLVKQPVDPRRRTAGVHDVTVDPHQRFSASDRVKLSYHTDGFAQFSGENKGKIISGRDPKTGKPKGLGLISRPFSSPASVGVTVWGIEAFDASDGACDGLVKFEPSDFYYRNCSPEDADAWHLWVAVFPTNVMPPLQYDGGRAVLDAMLPMNSGCPVRLKVLPLKRENVCIGAYVNRMISGFPSRCSSGWILHGPGDWNRYRKGHALVAFYPAEAIGPKPEQSLDLIFLQTVAHSYVPPRWDWLKWWRG